MICLTKYCQIKIKHKRKNLLKPVKIRNKTIRSEKLQWMQGVTLHTIPINFESRDFRVGKSLSTVKKDLCETW
jgi:hypothetical protein